MRKFSRSSGSAVLMLLLLILLVACSQKVLPSAHDKSIDRMDIYFRKFNTLAIIAYSEQQLINSAPVRVRITNKESINEILESISLKCASENDVDEKKMDTYLLIRMFRKNEYVGYWKSSPFHYFDSSSAGRVCTMSRSDRNRIEVLINNLNGSELTGL